MIDAAPQVQLLIQREGKSMIQYVNERLNNSLISETMAIGKYIPSRLLDSGMILIQEMTCVLQLGEMDVNKIIPCVLQLSSLYTYSSLV